MQIDATMHDDARARMRADAARRPQERAHGAPPPARGPRRGRGVRRATGRAHFVVSLLLMLLMPLGVLHRSSTGACLYDHGVAVGGSAVAAHDAGLVAPFGASAEQERTVTGDQHDHRDGSLPPDGAAPGACGPAAVAERPAPTGVTRPQALLPAWRALTPLALAAPPPAPPPRLS